MGSPDIMTNKPLTFSTFSTECDSSPNHLRIGARLKGVKYSKDHITDTNSTAAYTVCSVDSSELDSVHNRTQNAMSPLRNTLVENNLKVSLGQ